MQIAAHTTRSQQQQEPGVCVRCWETSRKVVFKPCCALLGGLIRNNKAYTYMLRERISCLRCWENPVFAKLLLVFALLGGLQKLNKKVVANAVSAAMLHNVAIVLQHAQ